ncbi:hypothetical protein E2K80_01975 [Rhodophyticola sp. CCM32]|uniref:hypothetical protein n=1 Tax=Rhodophyticola sp. CCM32 TaxID=2916397 RepID=UPI00107F9CF5|nr:hypothetical protein [Rhodophyticola sp. CCM32]QBX99642.1 hypothetical protein E2K80_01975 [Rhodophyticola sp. CCM32]
MVEDKPTFAFSRGHAELMEWMVECPDPDLWHEIVVGSDLTGELGLEPVLWIVQQPTCDMATAAAALVRLEAWEYVIVPVEKKAYADPLIFEIAKVICTRSEGDGYQRNKIGWDLGRLRFSPKVMLNHIYAFCEQKRLARDETYLPIPVTLLSGNYAKTVPQREYMIDAEGVTHISTLDAETRKAIGHTLH